MAKGLYRKMKILNTRCPIKGRTRAGFPVEKKVIEYAGNLLGRYKLTEDFLKFILSLLSIGSRRKLAYYLHMGKHQKKGADHPYEAHLEDIADASHLTARIIEDSSGRTTKVKERELERYIHRLWKHEHSFSVRKPGNFFEKQLSNLRALFHLDEDEIEAICFLYCYTQVGAFEDFCDNHRLADYLNLISIATGIPFVRLRRILGKKGRLVQNGVINEIDVRICPYYSLAHDIVEYMAGIAGTPLSEKYCRRDKGPKYSPGSFSVSECSTNIIRSLLSSDRPCNILLYGEAGCGKTEFTRAAVASCGKQAFFVQHGEDEAVSERRLALQVAVATVPLKAGVVIVDEADTLLNTRYALFTSRTDTLDKGWLNDFIDRSAAQIIWITNERDFMEESLLRRFSYSLQFKNFTRQERENIWIELIKKHPLKRFLDKGLIRKLAARYEVNAAGIASTLDTIKSIQLPEKLTKEVVRESLHELLTKHEDLISGETKRPFNPLSSHYDLSALNVDVEMGSLMRTMRIFVDRNQMVDQREGCHMNLLFWGRPGTGKTEFAKHVAAEIGMDLIIKRASDLLSPWVGVAEKNIRDAFDEAEREKAILLLDEADTFFINRESALRSWEKSQTNELLTQMENHRGILICCTNLLRDLDRAAMRRFQWKIEFKPLTKKGKISLYQNYFGTVKRRLTPGQKERLTDIPHLTPGDIKAVWQRYRFMPKEDIDHSTVILTLEKEVKYRGEDIRPKIGFGC